MFQNKNLNVQHSTVLIARQSVCVHGILKQGEKKHEKGRIKHILALCDAVVESRGGARLTLQVSLTNTAP